jgi:hypothetical protein
MTMDELDQIIKEEESKMVAIIQAEADGEKVLRKHRQSVQPENSIGTCSGAPKTSSNLLAREATSTTPVPPYSHIAVDEKECRSVGVEEAPAIGATESVTERPQANPSFPKGDIFDSLYGFSRLPRRRAADGAEHDNCL